MLDKEEEEREVDGDAQDFPQPVSVKALAQKFEERRRKNAKCAGISATLPTQKKNATNFVKRRTSARNQPYKKKKDLSPRGVVVSIALYKDRPGVSRRRSSVAPRKSASSMDLRTRKSPFPEKALLPKSKSASEGLSDISAGAQTAATPEVDESSSQKKTLIEVDGKYFRVDTPGSAKKVKPKTPPKPAFLVLDQEKKTVSVSSDYAEYDVQFSSQKSTPTVVPDSLAPTVVPPEQPESPAPTGEMFLVGSELDISGHIYCCLNASCGSSCSGCSSTYGQFLDDSTVSAGEIMESEKFTPALSPRNMSTPEMPPAKEGRKPTPPPVAPKSAAFLASSFHQQVSPVPDDLKIYEKMVEDMFAEAEEERLRNRCDPSSVSSTSWETGSSASTQSSGAKGARLIGFRSLSENREDYMIKEETTSPIGCLEEENSAEEKPEEENEEKNAAKPRIKKALVNRLRPFSQPSFDMDRLLRIKSDIQLNLAKQVGKIKLKVTSTSGSNENKSPTKSRKKRSSASTFYVAKGSEKQGGGECEETTSNSVSNPETPEQEVKGTFEFQLVPGDEAEDGDDHVFDDDWSDTDGGSEFGDDMEESTENSCLPDVVPAVGGNDSVVFRDMTEETENLEVNGNKEDETPVATLERDTVSPLALTSAFMSKSVSEILTKSPSLDEATGLGSPVENLQPTYTSRFIENQPLYQHYQRQSAMQALRVVRNESMSSTDTGEGEGDSVLGPSCSISLAGSARWCDKRKRLVASSNFGSQRSLWCELPEVKRAGLLDALGDQEKKLQEAMFEVITSEASYLRSLNILLTHFMAAPELSGNQNLSSVISSQDRKNLFSNILKVRDCSESLLSALESNFEEDLKLEDICGLLCEHFSKFDVYVKYCTNQVYQDRTLRRLKTEDGKFAIVLHQLEANPICEGLDMRSFLMLPMQRVTRYPLLVDAIFQRTHVGTERYENARKALALANKVVTRCNEGARAMERVEQLLDIDRRLIYRGELRKIPLVSTARYLVKQEELVQLRKSSDKYGTASRKNSLVALAAATPGRKKLKRLYLFLFTDLLMVTKKYKTGNYFTVRDYCARQFVEVSPLKPTDPKVPQTALAALGPYRLPHLFLCTLMQNAKGKQTELILCADSETDRARWMEGLSPPPQPANPEEAIYADWDCPQVQVVHQYCPNQEDELGLEPGDVVNVLRKMQDGWLEGEKLRDGSRGWFPGSYVVEILSDHVRARNYRQRLRLIQAAESLQQDQLRAKAEYTGRGAYPSGTARGRAKSEPARKNSLRHQLRRLSNPKLLFQVQNV